MARAEMPTVRLSGRRDAGPGFTLIELLVVIAVIGILAGIALVVGTRVAQGGKDRATTATLQVLDQALNEYVTSREGRVPSVFKDGDNRVFPLIDAREDGAQPDAAPENILPLVLAELAGAGGAEGMLKGLDSRLIRRAPIATSWGQPQRDGRAMDGVTVFDAYGLPIRFVHPAYDGGYGDYWAPAPRNQMVTRPKLDVTTPNGSRPFSRSYRPFTPGQVSGAAVGDADEGICDGNRPYFYSAGGDRDPGTRKDNLYTVRPQFPAETVSFK